MSTHADPNDGTDTKDLAAANVPPPLSASTGPLCDDHDVALLDLDGVVYVGPDAVPGVPEALGKTRAAGMQLAFVTNNAARPPDRVADHLSELGIAAQADEVITSAQAAARYLAERLPSGAQVLVVGTTGIEVALRERGLSPVDRDGDDVAAVVQGYSPTVDWALLAEGSVAIRRGVPWVATNVDPTVPSPRGPLPGNGSLVMALRTATGVVPVVTGKPDPTMHRETLIRTGAKSPIVVGDRLDTDIEGANAVGCPSLLVFSGVTTVGDLLDAPMALRPTYVGADAGALLVAHPSPRSDAGAVTCGAWRVSAGDGGIELSRPDGDGRDSGSDGPDHGGDRTGPFDGDALNAVRALAAAAWSAASPGPDDGGHPPVRAGDHAAGSMLRRLGLHDG